LLDAPDMLIAAWYRAALGNATLARVLRRRRPGLVHLHSPVQYGAIRHGLRFAGLKRIVHVHLEEDVAGLRWAFRSPPELIVTCARFLVQHVRMTLPDRLRDRQRIVAVPNTVDTEKYCPGDRLAAKASVGAPLDRPLLLMLANLAPHKGQETAIRAVAELKARGQPADCWLAGVERDGSRSFTTKLQSLIAELGVTDRVRLLGHRSDSAELLRAADVFLLPSTREGLPLSVLEAQATKLPVVAAATAGVPEVVCDGETGFLVPAHDHAGYAARVRELLLNPALVRRITDRAYDQVQRDHKWQSYRERIWELYVGLMEANAWECIA
jgi:glycosyltransferase involved in cell wall biosynthesis